MLKWLFEGTTTLMTMRVLVELYDAEIICNILFFIFYLLKSCECTAEH